MIRGQVWEYISGSRQHRVLIISNDEYNHLPDVSPWGLFVTRERYGAGGLVVDMIAGDPLPGAQIRIPTVVRIDRTALRTNLGFVTAATINAVEYGLREFLVLP